MFQDVSYECCIEVQGNRQTIIEALSHLCSKDTGKNPISGKWFIYLVLNWHHSKEVFTGDWISC